MNKSSSEKTILIVPLGNVPPEHVKATAMQPPTLVQLGLKQSAEMSLLLKAGCNASKSHEPRASVDITVNGSVSGSSKSLVGFSTAAYAGFFPLSFPWTWEDQMVCREVPNIDPRYDLASHNESKRAGLSPPFFPLPL
mgnify:CR=1 FL=1